MVTRWGMSEHVGVMFVAGRAGGSAGGLNLRSHHGDAPSAHSRTLVADGAGRLLLNGGNAPAPQPRSAPVDATASETSRSSMATLIDLEMQHLLSEGYHMAKTVLSEHYDQLDRLAHALLEHEQLDRAAFEQLVRV